MSRCVSDRTLLLLHQGEGNFLQQAHVQQCPPCAARSQLLIRDLQIIGDVLWDTPPPTVARRASRFSRRWRPVAAVLAAMLIVLWVRGERESLLPSPVQPDQSEEVQQFLEKEIAPALFSTVDTTVETVPTPVDHLTYVQAALEGTWPCERQGTFGTLACDIHPFPLFIEGR